MLLSNPDLNGVMKAATMVSDALQYVNIELLKGDIHMNWMKQLNSMNLNLGKIKNSKDIEIQREGFAAFNLALYQAIKEFGMNKITAYYQFCPMAFNSKGAYWLSESETIQNPYFGKKMLTCGDTRETLKF
jgi:membrane fusion protein, copper/silver efflux system